MSQQQPDTHSIPEQQEIEEHDQLAQRQAKLAALRQQGLPFPNDFRRDSLAAELLAQYAEREAEALNAEAIPVKIAGRMMTRRVMGKAAFAHLLDMSGRIQVYLRKNDLPEGVYEAFKHWDLGDILGVSGSVFKTKTGELSVKAEDIRLLTKALRPLPEKFHGLSDMETRYRQRYLDLIVNQASRDTFILRSKVITYLREFLIQRGFLEVETPMMQVIPGGARARPFVTHHNALDMPLYLRIAPELYLKRLVVGGLEKVFELNRCFRNEGVSTRHNPEFTMLEFYLAYADYHELMDLTEEMLRGLTLATLGEARIQYQGEEYDLGQPFARLSLFQAVLEYNPDISAQQLASLEDCRRIAAGLGIKVKDGDTLGKLQLEIFEATVEEKLSRPTFITEYPIEGSPLARRSDQNPAVTDRFELFVGGREIANGFSELNDPEDQAERFRNQVAEHDAGDEEAMLYDADYVTALEHGLPPTAGEGIGIDRLIMLLADQPSIRDVLLFPHMRAKAEN